MISTSAGIPRSPTELRAEGRSFTIEVVQPESPRERELRGRVRFGAGAARKVNVGLSLLGQAGKTPMGSEGIDAQTPIAGCSTSVEHSSEVVPFTLPLPPVARAYDGDAFTIGVGVVATADDGDSLCVLVDVPLVSQGRLVLRGLPKQMPLARPGRFAIGLWFAVLGAALVTLGATNGMTAASGAGGIVLAASLVFAARARHGVLGWLRVGAATAELEIGGDVSELVARVRGGPRIAGGRLRLVAIEYIAHAGASFEGREITSREASLSSEAPGIWSARLALPAASEAPPALALRAAKRLFSIRWLAKLELATKSGSVERCQIPLHVGIELMPDEDAAPSS